MIDDGTKLMRAIEDTPEYVSEPVTEDNAAPKIPPLRMWDIDEIMNYRLSDNDNILGDRLIAAGELTLFIGPPDIGKSRLVTQLVFDILLGRDTWLGVIPIHQEKKA